jgi:hypothetical protein
MATTEHDVVFSWVSGGTRVFYKFRLKRGVEGGAYKERQIRAEISQQLLTQAENPSYQSRPDSAAMYQTSWTDGARWWRPIIGPGDAASYFQSNHMDTWSEPGKVVPMNLVDDAANTNIHDHCVTGVGAAGAVYAVGSTNTEDATNLDVYVWTPASDAFVRDAGLTSGVDDAADPMAMTYDPNDGYFYVLASDDDLERFNPTTNAQNANWITTGFTAYAGANIFLHNQFLMFYSGDQIYTVTKATPAVTSVFNDGMGPEFLSGASFAGTEPLFRENLLLAISTPEGIFAVKNTRQGGQPQPWVFRVDRDAAGNWIGNPLAPLPLGSVALSIAYHLGSVVIAATPDWGAAVDNDADAAGAGDCEIELYHYTDGQPGALGVMLGRDEMDETPFALLGSSGPLLYVGGHKRLWIWDAIRGGLHTAFSWPTTLTNGPYRSMAWVTDSDGDSAMIWLGRDRIARQKRANVADPDLVTAFGDDETHYTLESNYFDANLPMEDKRLALVEVLFDPSTETEDVPNQEWTIQISVDDAAFTDVITSATTGVDMTTGYAANSGSIGPRGRLFRYKLIYQTKTAVKNALKSILATFTTGRMVKEWELVLDLDEVLNVENEIVSEDQVLTDLQFVLDDTAADIISMLINFDADKDADTAFSSTTYEGIKIMSLEVMKDKPTEGTARIVVREDPLTATL